MSSGAKQKLYVGIEATRNVPATTLSVVEFTESSLDQTLNKGSSTAVTDSRMSSGTYISGVNIAGNIGVEAKKSTVLENIMECAAFNPWVGDVLTFGGETRKTLTVVRGFADLNNYHQFTGVTPNTFGIEIPLDGPITYSFGLMGMKRTKLAAAPAGATPASENDIITSVSVGTIEIDGQVFEGGCIESFSFNVDNSAQVQKCLGKGLEIGAIIEGESVITGSFVMAWGTPAADFYEKQFLNEKIAIKVPYEDAAGTQYLIQVPVAEITLPLASGGKSDVLKTTFNWTAVRQKPTITRGAPIEEDEP